jgi:hypothetical protein
MWLYKKKLLIQGLKYCYTKNGGAGGSLETIIFGRRECAVLRKGLVYESGFELTCMRTFVEKRND